MPCYRAWPAGCPRDKTGRGHRVRRLTLIITVLLCALLSGRAGATSPADTVLIREGDSFPDVIPHARYVVDREGRLDLKALLAGEAADRWQDFPGQELAAGYVPGGAVWVHLRVQRTTANVPRDWWLDAAWGFTDYITLHLLRPDGSQLVRESGRAHPFVGRDLPWAGHGFRLQLDESLTYDIYLRYAGTGSLRIPLQLVELRAFDTFRQRETLFAGAFFGIMGMIGLIALLRAAFQRSVVDASYGGYILAMETNNLVVSGWIQALGITDDVTIMRLAGAIAVMVAALLLTNFLRMMVVWPTDRIAQRLERGMAWCLLAYPIGLLVTLILQPMAINWITNTVSGLLVIVIALLGSLAAWRDYPNARMFLAAFSPFLFAILARYLQSYSLIPGHLLTQYVIMVATLVHGIALMLVILVRDARERANQQAIQWELATARTGIDNQSTFMRMLAHEARTPLAVIDGQAQLLASEPADPVTAGRAVTHIRDAIHRLGLVLDRFMSQDRLLATTPMQKQRVDLASLLGAVAARAQRTTDQHLIQLKVDAGGTAVHGDFALLEVLFQNLVDNAIHYSPEGGAVHIAVVEAGAQLQVTVSDEGVGIPRELQEKVFEPYFRAGTVPGAIGAGLGLSLVRKIARLHGGDVALESVPDAGSTFTVHLPRA